MPRGGPLIFEDFVLKALNNGTYGEILEWVDQNLGIFSLKLTHKNNTMWKEDRDVKIFVDWDKLKGRQNKSDSYLTDAKQRFKNGLIKSQSVEKADPVTLNAFGLKETKNCLFYKYNPRPRKPTKSSKKRAITKSRTSPKNQIVVNQPTPPTSPESEDLDLNPMDEVTNIMFNTNINNSDADDIRLLLFQDFTSPVESPILPEATTNEQVVPAASPNYPDIEMPWDENEQMKEMSLLNDTYLFQGTIIAEEDIIMSSSSSSSEVPYNEDSFNIYEFFKNSDLGADLSL